MDIQSEINRDPVLSNWMKWEIDYKHFDNQVNLKCVAIKIAIARQLDKKHK